MQWTEKGSGEAKQCLDEVGRLQYLGRRAFQLENSSCEVWIQGK